MPRMTRRLQRRWAWLFVFLATPVTALAQPVPTPAQPAAQPTPPSEDGLGPGDPVQSKEDPLAKALAPKPGGLTLAFVGERAQKTSPALVGKQAEADASSAAVDQATVQLFPKLSLVGSYTRLSSVEGGAIGGGGASLVTANEGQVTVGPCPDNPAAQCVLDSGGSPVQAASTSFSFPVLLNQWNFTASLLVPVSDYFLRSVQALSAAEHNEEASRLEVEAQSLTVAADAKIALLSWIQARGQTVVAGESVEQVKGQLKDAKLSEQAGVVSRADVMRIEARAAQVDLALAEAVAVEKVAEQRLRIQLRLPPNAPLEIGIDVLTPTPPPALEPTESLVSEGLSRRLELVALTERRTSLDDADDAQTAAYLPRLDAFADATLANPNQRIFPSEDKFQMTWDVGLRLSWTVNDTFSNLGGKAQARARVRQVDAQKDQLGDSIRLEVVSARSDLERAVVSLTAADRGVLAAEESLRVTKKLFALGRATGTALVDSETELTSARLRKLSARVGIVVAQIRLEHATGRDRPQRTAAN